MTARAHENKAVRVRVNVSLKSLNAERPNRITFAPDEKLNTTLKIK